MSQRIAIVGAGISGLTAAWYLSRHHQVEVFEANDYLGGHTCTVPVSREHGDYAIDVGFIVFNDRTYPNYLRLLDELGLQGRPTAMGFAVGVPLLPLCLFWFARWLWLRKHPGERIAQEEPPVLDAE